MAVDRRLFKAVLQSARFWNAVAKRLNLHSRILAVAGRYEESRMATILSMYLTVKTGQILSWLHAHEED